MRNNIIEDVTLARRVKQRGFRLRMADGAGLVVCRMYNDWTSVRRGFAKNILAGYGGVIPLLVATLFHSLIFLFPWILLLLSRFSSTHAHLTSHAFVLIGLGIIIRALSAAVTRQRIADAPLMPISVLLMTVIAAQSIVWHFRDGGPQWKGRTISPRPLWYRGVGGKG